MIKKEHLGGPGSGAGGLWKVSGKFADSTNQTMQTGGDTANKTVSDDVTHTSHSTLNSHAGMHANRVKRGQMCHCHHRRYRRPPMTAERTAACQGHTHDASIVPAIWDN